MKHFNQPTILGLEDDARGKNYFTEAINFVEFVRINVLELFCCIRASNFRVENKCVGNILFYNSLQFWS